MMLVRMIALMLEKYPLAANKQAGAKAIEPVYQ